MAGHQNEDLIRESLRYLSQSLGALLRGASGDARAMLDLADEEIEKIRVQHDHVNERSDITPSVPADDSRDG